MAIKAVVQVTNILPTSPVTSTDLLITIVGIAGISPLNLTFGPYAQNLAASSRDAALKADVISYCTTALGITFGLLDTVQILGGALDL